MKQVILFLLVLSSCSQNSEIDSTVLVGRWKLIERLVDPGDGSGTYQPVSGNSYIDFFADGTFTANTPMCPIDQANNQPSSGTYDSVSLILSFNNCSSFVISYEISGNNLILHPPCFEDCGSKYIKISSH